jgi:fidgetin-like protein 1
MPMKMEQKFYELRKMLEERGLAGFPSFLPHEKRDCEITRCLKEYHEMVMCEIAKDHTLISLLPTISSLPIEADLDEVAALLSGYEQIPGDFFATESQGAPEPSSKEAYSGFATASNRAVKKDKSDVGRECNMESYILDRIRNEILEKSVNIGWDDIVGLENVKKTVNEIVLWPMLRPDLFTGLRGPPKGLLLFGPPGTGKTMIGKCIASQCKATFFSISASSLTSKWVGEGEKMVRALFHLARTMQPSVVFIDEIDSLLSQRSENENEGSRRIKTEFLVQFDGAATSDQDRILVIGATNRPHEIDEAARRRLVKRIYVPLPDKKGRRSMVGQLIGVYNNDLGVEEMNEIATMTSGYSGSDIFNLCREASLEPLREIDNIQSFRPEDTRPIGVRDFKKAMNQIKKSVSEHDLEVYHDWNGMFGSIA